MTESVLRAQDGAILTLTLNRPQARNSLTIEMKEALLAALSGAAAADETRAVVITGAGEAFCAGQDLREHAGLLESGTGPGGTVRDHYNAIALAVMTMGKPVIAAVNGSAAGAGASLALACDFRLAARRASFLMAFARVGLGPDTGASWTLQRLIGAGRAAEMMLLAEPVRAEDAPPGRLTAVVADDDRAGAAAALARRLADGPTAAYAGIKAALAYAACHDLASSLEYEAVTQERLGATADHRAATAAFVRKEPPRYTGR